MNIGVINVNTYPSITIKNFPHPHIFFVRIVGARLNIQFRAQTLCSKDLDGRKMGIANKP